MKTYTRTHEEETAAKGHVANIKNRGGLASVEKANGKYLVKYSFPDKQNSVADKADKLRTKMISQFKLKDIGVTNSETDYGNSSYLTFYFKDELYKIRISDHDATNTVRVEREIMFTEKRTVEEMLNSIEQILFPERFYFVPVEKGEKPTHIKNGKPCVMKRK